MRSNDPHPAFIGCLGLAMVGVIVSVMMSAHFSNCKAEQGSSESCTTKNQVRVDATTTWALCSVVVAIAGLGFQLTGAKKSAPAPPPPAPYPIAGGPPRPGPLPPAQMPPHPTAPPHPPSGQS
jgi:hypothetical protein